MILESFESKLQNKRVSQFTDNQNVVRIVLNWSKTIVYDQESRGLWGMTQEWSQSNVCWGVATIQMATKPLQKGI